MISYRAARTCVALALIAPAFVGPPEPEKVPLMCVREDHDFTLAQIRGRMVAVHFVVQPDHPGCRASVREYFDNWPRVAGVTHVFVLDDDATTVKAWAEPFKDAAIMIAADTGGKLAAGLKVYESAPDPRPPATVLLDAAGAEMFRRIGGNPDDPLTFAEFARRLDRAAGAPALAHYNLPKNEPVAVNGYDVVAYFTPGTPAKGSREYESRYRGIEYHFSSAQNRRIFALSPERYVPTYGGWCASAMGAKGTKVEIDPENFKIKDGRLHLFFKSFFGDALKDWNKNEKTWEPAADANWKKLTGEDPIAPRK